MTKYLDPKMLNLSPLLSTQAATAEPADSPRASRAWSLADLLVELDNWTELSPQTRRILKAHVRAAGFAALAAQARAAGPGRPVVRDDAMLAGAPADPIWLNQHLYAFPAAILGINKPYLAVSISSLRRVMRRLGLIEPDTSAIQLPTHQRWQELLAQLEKHVLCRGALQGLARWCQANGIEPEQVSRATLERFENFIRTRTLHSEIPRLIRTITKAWRKAAALLQDWPQGQLTAPPRRDTYTLPFSAFPVSFQHDVDAFRRRLEGSGNLGPFRNAGQRAPLRPPSVKGRLYNLRQAASALVVLGRDPASIIGLADLVDEAAFESILLFFWERAMTKQTASRGILRDGADPDFGRTAQTSAIASALMIVAKYHCKLTGDTLTRLRNMAQDMTPSRQGQLSQKNRDRLRQFDDPMLRARLLHLPERLMRQAEKPGMRPLEAARLARVATAIEILFHIPLRNSNLTQLRLGVHLQYADARRDYISHLILQPHETKNRYSGEWAVGPELSSFLHRYIRVFRPVLAMAGDDWLFPAGFGKSGSLSTEAMAQQITCIVANEVGAVINTHLFRCLCARFVLEHSPNALEDVRLLIGDKSLQVVLAHYAAVEPGNACRRNDALLRRMRSVSGHLVGLPSETGPRPVQ